MLFRSLFHYSEIESDFDLFQIAVKKLEVGEVIAVVGLHSDFLFVFPRPSGSFREKSAGEVIVNDGMH